MTEFEKAHQCLAAMLVGVCFLVCPVPISAQDNAALVQDLYLLAATPTPRDYVAHSAELYGFSPSGQPLLIRTITEGGQPVKERGVNFVRFDDDGRIIVIATPFTSPNRLTLIRMDVPDIPVVAPIPIPDMGSPWLPWTKADGYIPDSWRRRGFAPSAGMGWILQSSGARSVLLSWLDGTRGTIMTVIPIGVMGFGPSRAAADEDRILRQMTGRFGLFAPVDDGDGDAVRILNGRVVLNGIGGKPFDIGLTVPPLPSHLASTKGFGLIIRNTKMSVLSVQEDRGVKERHLFVCVTKTGKWATYRVPGESSPVIRPCGSWILGVAAFEAWDRLPRGDVIRKKQESPGRKDRLTIARNSEENSYKAPSGKLRANPFYWVDGSRNLYPGVLYAIDTDTGRMIQFNTDQGDSELLAVRNEVLYYRVNNRLFAKRISGTTVGPAILLAEHEAIPEVHWAFFRN
jgi:hypothetical protein